ncbi:MAG TPA: hypothetical protein GXZ22_08680 [Clostridiaceae bacterium]|jgi:hypothetical protein|nr:hypothetical protein [Clostridiaceae bacterium]
MFIGIKGTFAKNKDYVLTIYILSDVARQEYITEQAFTFTADYGSADVMKISRVRALDSNTVEVRFSLPLNKDTATMTNYYTIRGDGFSYTINPEKVFFDPSIDSESVKLYLPENKKLEKKRDYILTIDSRMQDYLGNTLGKSIKEDFSGVTLAAGTPTIDDAATISSDAIKLTFDREIALDAPNILTNNYVLEYSISDTLYKKVPLSVIYINAKTVILKFDYLEEDDDISFIIKYNKLKDYSGVEGIQGQTEVRHGDK